jgi:hypothetical protein
MIQNEYNSFQKYTAYLPTQQPTHLPTKSPMYIPT